jgi:putative ABC transport system permease protein
VGLHYTQLVLVLSALGLAGGALGGWWLGGALVDLYADYFRFPLLAWHVDPSTGAIAALLTLGAAAAGGAVAIRRAFRLSPAVAMAPPMPTRYRPGVLAKLMGRLGVSQPTRMIVRHLTRWPVRTGLTATGIALSIALMILALFFVASVEQVVDVYFFQSQRQHMTVTFAEPRPADIEWELARLPGVLQTQPARVVPVKLRAGPYEKRQSLIGMAPQGDLSRTLDSQLRPFSPPPQGIALSAKLADDLRVRPGDVIMVEAMEGRRPTVQVEVTALVEEYLGFATYMPLAAVNRLMREGPVISEVHLLIDTLHQEALDRQLKNTPGVAGIVQQQASLRSFRETLDQTMFVQVFFYTLFSGIVAFGVSWNAARIALSERSRALASLRVLGFSRGEVSYILIGELGVITLLALPLGVTLGLAMVRAMAPLLQTDMYRFPAVVNAATLGWSVLVVAVASLVCWWMIHRRLQRLNPAEALKTRD